MTIVEADRAIIGGVDTHLDVHVAAALDPIGGLLGVESFAAAPRGYRAMLEWLGAFPHRGQDRCGGHRRLWRRPGPVPAPSGHRGGRGRPSQPPGATDQGQVGLRRRRRSGPGGVEWPCRRHAQVP